MINDRTSNDELLRAVLDETDPQRARELLVGHASQIDETFLQELGRNIERDGTANPAQTRERLELGIEAARLSGHIRILPFFLCQLGLIDLHQGQLDRASETLDQARNEALHLMDRGDRGALQDFVAASTAAVDLELRRNDFEAAHGLLSKLRRHCHQLGAPSGELWANLNLGLINRGHGDLEAALQYAEPTYQQFKTVGAEPQPEVQPPDVGIVYQFFDELASNLYYDRKDLVNAAVLAGWAVELNPQGPGAYYTLGLAQIGLKQYEQSLPTWQHGIALDPNHAFWHMNYAGALTQLGRLQDALKETTAAIQLEPNKPAYYLARGQLFQRLDQHTNAIGDFDCVMEMARLANADMTPRTSLPRSQLEYMTSFRERDLVDFARRFKMDSLVARGETERALAEADAMIQGPDTAARVAGYEAKADLHLRSGQAHAALDAYSHVLTLSPRETRVRATRADLYLAQGQVGPALDDLAVLADHTNDPAFAITRLSALLKQQPDLTLAHKWRGYAYYQAMRLSLAEDDLTRAMQTLPKDADLYLWRGLTRITHSDLPEEAAWNKEFSARRVRDALEDLGTAALLTPNKTEALDAFKWLVDRTTADSRILETLVVGDPQYSILIRVIPSLAEFFALPGSSSSNGRFWRAFDLKWRDAIREFQACQTALLEAGLPVFATRLHLNIADNCLQLYELQAALDHLAQAEKVLFMWGAPLSPHLLAQAEESKRRVWQQTVRQAVHLEIEYVDVYQIGSAEFDEQLKFLKTQALARTGDPKGALSALGDIERYARRIEQADVDPTVIRMVLAIAVILRDAGEYQRAAELAQKLEPHVEDPAVRLSLLNFAGTLMQCVGADDVALEALEQARELAARTGSELLQIIDMSIAVSFNQQGQYQRALEQLQQISIEEVARAEHDKYLYYALLAQVMLSLERFQDAQDAIAQALAIVESTRADFRRYETRISWQASLERVYRIAVNAAAASRDMATMFEFIEKSRSRALVDQLAAGHLPLPESAQFLADAENRLLDQRERLVALTDSYKQAGAAFVDYQALRELQTLGFTKELLETNSEGSRQLSISKLAAATAEIDDTLGRLQREMEEARLTMRRVASGSVLSLTELRRMLQTPVSEATS
jgi:tetratricopeptide (TPR) repeat protein